MRRRAAAYAGAAAVAVTVGLGANLGLFGLVQPDSDSLPGPAGSTTRAAEPPHTTAPAPLADD